VLLLLFVLDLNVAEAAPLALLAVGLSAGMGAIIGLRAGIVRYRAAGFIALTGIVSSPVGLWLAHRLPNGPRALLFAGVPAFVAIRMFIQARGSDAKASAGSQHVPPMPARRRLRPIPPGRPVRPGAGTVRHRSGISPGSAGSGWGLCHCACAKARDERIDACHRGDFADHHYAHIAIRRRVDCA
jgi:uncharacterized membrane protein YfcA